MNNVHMKQVKWVGSKAMCILLGVQLYMTDPIAFFLWCLVTLGP